MNLSGLGRLQHQSNPGAGMQCDEVMVDSAAGNERRQCPSLCAHGSVTQNDDAVPIINGGHGFGTNPVDGCRHAA